MKCEKCGYEPAEKKLDLNEKKVYLCSICSHFAPSSEKLEEYLKEKIDWKSLESFRKFSGKNISGMKNKASQGEVMSRAPFGYRIENKKLVPDQEKSLQVQEIFRDFLDSDISLTQLAKKHALSVNGLKKILRNFTYIGKVKFSGQISQGSHEKIISPELFNKVQNKIEESDIK